MIHWGWLVATAIVSASAGAFIMAILAVCSESDTTYEYYVENQRLRDEIRYLKSKLGWNGDDC